MVNATIFMRMYHYCLHIFLVFVTVMQLSFFSHNEKPMYIPYILPTLLAMVLLYYFLKTKKINNVFLLLPILVGSLLIYLYSLPVFFSLLFYIYLTYTLLNFIYEMKDFTQSQDRYLIFFLISMVILLVLKSSYHYSYSIHFYTLTYMYLLLFMCGSYLQRKVKISPNAKMIDLYKIVATLIGVMVVIAFIAPYLKEAIKWGLSNVFMFIGLLFTPIFYVIKFLLSLGNKSKEVEEAEQELFENKQTELPISDSYMFDDGLFLLIGMIVFIIITIVLVVFVLKKKNLYEISPVSKARLETFKTNAPIQNVKPVKYSILHNELRKLVRKLHIKARKYEKTRLVNESLQEWFTRIGILQRHTFIETYEKLRYGNIELSKDELQDAIVTCKKIIKQLKDSNKTKKQ